MELLKVLDASHAAAVIDHRQRIKHPLTAYAAKLLAGKFAKCPNPNAAADAMVANGWQGFEGSWMQGRSEMNVTGNGTIPLEPKLDMDPLAVARRAERATLEAERLERERPDYAIRH